LHRKESVISYIIKRFLTIIPVLFCVATITFFLIRLAPGGPFASEKPIPKSVEENINKKYGLNLPLSDQYFRYMKGLVMFDLGPSYKYPNRTVNEIIFQSFPISLLLGSFAILISVVIGIVGGMIAALKQNTKVDYIIMFFSLIGISTPSFVLAPLLVLFFALHLGWFPVAGFDSFRSMVLPAISLSAIYTAYIARLSRSGMLDIIKQDYIKTARAKGLSEPVILFRHGLKGALLPVISFMGPAFTGVLTGSMVIETIFNIPGLGRYFVNGAINRDYTLVIGTALFVATIIFVMNFIVDIAYAFLDPRVRYGDN